MGVKFLQNFFDVLRGKAVFAYFYKKKYDAVFSLGNNCELCIRLRDSFFGINFESFLFNWTAISDRDKFLELLEGGVKNLASDEFCFLDMNDMFHSTYFKIGVHSRYKKEELSKNPILQKEALNEIKSRLNHLVQKTENLFNSDKSIIFIAKVIHKNFEDDFNYIKKLYEIILKSIINPDSRKIKFLFIIQKEDYNDEEFQKLCLKFKNFKKERFEIKRVEKFANSGMRNSDKRGWIKILKKEIFI